MGSSSIYSSRYSFEGGLYGRVVSFCRLGAYVSTALGGVPNIGPAGKRGR